MESLLSGWAFNAVYEAGVCTRAIIVNRIYDEPAVIYIY